MGIKARISHPFGLEKLKQNAPLKRETFYGLFANEPDPMIIEDNASSQPQVILWVSAKDVSLCTS